MPRAQPHRKSTEVKTIPIVEKNVISLMLNDKELDFLATCANWEKTNVDTLVTTAVKTYLNDKKNAIIEAFVANGK